MEFDPKYTLATDRLQPGKLAGIMRFWVDKHGKAVRVVEESESDVRLQRKLWERVHASRGNNKEKRNKKKRDKRAHLGQVDTHIERTAAAVGKWRTNVKAHVVDFYGGDPQTFVGRVYKCGLTDEKTDHLSSAPALILNPEDGSHVWVQLHNLEDQLRNNGADEILGVVVPTVPPAQDGAPPSPLVMYLQTAGCIASKASETFVQGPLWFMDGKVPLVPALDRLTNLRCDNVAGDDSEQICRAC